MHSSHCASPLLTGAFSRREPRFVRQHHLEAMVPQAKASKDATALITAMLFLTSYIFMLRLPSEAIPIAKNVTDEYHIGQKATLSKEDDELVLRLESRKNLQRGAVIRRCCWCHRHPKTCPIHVLWHFFESLPDGMQPFLVVTKEKALLRLRNYMSLHGEKDAYSFRTQDLRRGHAADLKKNGASMDTIRGMGQWRSTDGPRPYMPWEEAERDAVAAAYGCPEALSDSEGGCPSDDDDEEVNDAMPEDLARELEELMAD